MGIKKSFCKLCSAILTNQLSGKLILILGAHRSGTTLTFMVLTSHPAITGKDEGEANFNFPTGRELLNNCLNRKITCFKMPNATMHIDVIGRRFKHATIIYLMRHPYAVISSAKKLVLTKESENHWIKRLDEKQLKKNTDFLNRLARNVDGVRPLRDLGPLRLKRHARFCPEINRLDLDNMDDVSLGAYLWKTKAMMIEKLQEIGVKVSLVRYEDLVEDPRRTLEPILQRMGIKFDDRMLVHHEVHAGKYYCGGAVGSRLIDKTRIKPELDLSADEMKTIDSICGDYVARYIEQKPEDK
jgi:hypothetical protein